MKELPRVLWAYRTIARKPIGISPFALTYGMEAVIPTEIGLPTTGLLKLENSYNKQVKPRVFQPGDLVLRRVFENTVDPTVGKFQPN